MTAASAGLSVRVPATSGWGNNAPQPNQWLAQQSARRLASRRCCVALYLSLPPMTPAAIWTAAAAAALTAFGGLVPDLGRASEQQATADQASDPELAAQCPAGTLPDA